MLALLLGLGCDAKPRTYQELLRKWGSEIQRKKGCSDSISFRVQGGHILISSTRLEIQDGAKRPVGDPLPSGFYVYPTNRVYRSIDAIIDEYDIRSLDKETDESSETTE